MNTDNKALADFGQQLIAAFWTGYNEAIPRPYPIQTRQAEASEKPPEPLTVWDGLLSMPLDYLISGPSSYLERAEHLGRNARNAGQRAAVILAEAGHSGCVLYGDWKPQLRLSVHPQGNLVLLAEFRDVLAAPDEGYS